MTIETLKQRFKFVQTLQQMHKNSAPVFLLLR